MQGTLTVVRDFLSDYYTKFADKPSELYTMYTEDASFLHGSASFEDEKKNNQVNLNGIQVKSFCSHFLGNF